MLSPARIRELLRELDDPEHLELPRGHDLPAARVRFDRLAAALEHRFGPSVTAGRAQDASFHGFVTVPATATGAGRLLWVLMSNFGPFVTAGTGKNWGMPGCEEGLDEEFVAWLDELCAELGCLYVPVTVLMEPYDGPTLLEEEELPGEDTEEDPEEELPPAWYDRYFQYM